MVMRKLEMMRISVLFLTCLLVIADSSNISQRRRGTPKNQLHTNLTKFEKGIITVMINDKLITDRVQEDISKILANSRLTSEVIPQISSRQDFGHFDHMHHQFGPIWLPNHFPQRPIEEEPFDLERPPIILGPSPAVANPPPFAVNPLPFKPPFSSQMESLRKKMHSEEVTYDDIISAASSQRYKPKEILFSPPKQSSRFTPPSMWSRPSRPSRPSPNYMHKPNNFHQVLIKRPIKSESSPYQSFQSTIKLRLPEDNQQWHYHQIPSPLHSLKYHSSQNEPEENFYHQVSQEENLNSNLPSLLKDDMLQETEHESNENKDKSENKFSGQMVELNDGADDELLVPRPKGLSKFHPINFIKVPPNKKPFFAEQYKPLVIDDDEKFQQTSGKGHQESKELEESQESQTFAEIRNPNWSFEETKNYYSSGENKFPTRFYSTTNHHPVRIAPQSQKESHDLHHHQHDSHETHNFPHNYNPHPRHYQSRHKLQHENYPVAEEELLASGSNIQQVLPSILAKPINPPVTLTVKPTSAFEVLTEEQQQSNVQVNEFGVGNYVIPGIAGVDYPNLAKIPKSDFFCNQKLPGFYADVDNNCQVWHFCRPGGEQKSYLCPNGTIFNQRHFLCDWWYNVKCNDSPYFYILNSELISVYRITPNDNSHSKEVQQNSQFNDQKIQNTINHVSKNTAQNVVQNFPHSTPKNVVHSIPQSTPMNVVHNIPQSTPMNVVHNIPQNDQTVSSTNVNAATSTPVQTRPQTIIQNGPQHLDQITHQQMFRDAPVNLVKHKPETIINNGDDNEIQNSEVESSPRSGIQNMVLKLPQFIPQKEPQVVVQIVPHTGMQTATSSPEIHTTTPTPQLNLQNTNLPTHPNPSLHQSAIVEHQSSVQNLPHMTPQNIPQSVHSNFLNAFHQPQTVGNAMQGQIQEKPVVGQQGLQHSLFLPENVHKESFVERETQHAMIHSKPTLLDDAKEKLFPFRHRFPRRPFFGRQRFPNREQFVKRQKSRVNTNNRSKRPFFQIKPSEQQRLQRQRYNRLQQQRLNRLQHQRLKNKK